MDIRYSCNQRDFKRYTTEETRNEMLITGLYKADEMVAVYSHVDRMVTLGCMPVHEEVSIDKGIDVWANFGTHYFLERREIGIFNIGDGAGTVTADGKEYHLNYKDCLYLTKGNQKVTFKSDDPEHPAKFYMVSAPAHCRYETRLITLEQAAKRPLGSLETCNKRTINQFIHPSVLKTCQLSMGMTCLEPGSNWNTMPSHTHERRMEIYTLSYTLSLHDALPICWAWCSSCCPAPGRSCPWTAGRSSADRKSTRLNSSHSAKSRMPSSA